MHTLTPDMLTAGSPLAGEIERRARASSGRLIATAAELGNLAELSWQEHRTTAYLARRLADSGWRVETTDPTGLIAQFGPTASALAPIALRMELDALPDGDGRARHLCGHNYHMAAVMEAAEILADVSRRYGVRVVILGQPAEEAGTARSGADLMIEAGGIYYNDERVRGVLAFHGLSGLRYGKIAVLPNGGPFYAGTAEIVAKIAGPGGHGGRPHTTVRLPRVFGDFLHSLEDAIAFRTLPPYKPVVFGFNTIHTGNRFNIIPTEGEAHGNLRWFDDKTPEDAKRVFDEVVSAFNTREGIDVSVEFEVGYHPTVVDPALARHMAEAAAQVATVVAAEPTTLAEDMGKYGRAGVPVGFATVGLGERDYPEDGGVPNPAEHHSTNFTVSRAAEQHIWKGTHMLVVSALMAIAAAE